MIGSGPNGLAAAVTLARAGIEVTVYEAADQAGGGCRTESLTLPGYRHDVGAAVHPLAVHSPFFRAFGLAQRIELMHPEVSFAHPRDNEPALLAWRDLERTVEELGPTGTRYRHWVAPLTEAWHAVADITLHPIATLPRHPRVALRLAARALSARVALAHDDDPATTLLAGVAAHAILPLDSLAAVAAGLSLASYAHAGGWPIAWGGSGAIIDALLSDLEQHGGSIITGHSVASLADLDDLANTQAVLYDTSARAMVAIGGEHLSAGYRRALGRLSYGNAAAKVDLALAGPVPWRDPALEEAATIHLGGSASEIAAAEASLARGRMAERPYVLVSQPSALDPSRAPAPGTTLWAYTHVPAGAPIDPSEIVLSELERHAPGVRDLVRAHRAWSAPDLERISPNYVLGDIASGAPNLKQLLARPRLCGDPWYGGSAQFRPGVSTGFYLASASATPGPGVHGMAGFLAARSALRRSFGIATPPVLGPGDALLS